MINNCFFKKNYNNNNKYKKGQHKKVFQLLDRFMEKCKNYQ